MEAMHAGVPRKPAQLGLIISMIFGAFMLWIGSPVIWLWIGSQMTSSQQGRMGPYFVVAIGILASTIAVAFGLAKLQRLYEQVTGQEATVRVRLAWLRSLRDDRQPDTRITVLDLILVTTAVLGVLTFVVWFALFAGSPLPG
jgi:hypothetical protein